MSVYHVVTALCVSYAAAVCAWTIAPVHDAMPKDVAYTVAGQGCPWSGVLSQSTQDPVVADKVFPILTVERGYRGKENDRAAQSCDRIVASVRQEAPWSALVPRRYICKSVRKWAIDAMSDAHRDVGGEAWIYNDEVIPVAKNFEFVKDQGLKFVKVGLHVRLVRSKQ